TTACGPRRARPATRRPSDSRATRAGATRSTSSASVSGVPTARAWWRSRRTRWSARRSRCASGRRSASRPSLRRGGLAALVADDVGEDFVQVERRLPADGGVDLLDRRLAMQHVLDAEAVDVLVRDELELGRGTGRLEDTSGELEDADPLRGPDVE